MKETKYTVKYTTSFKKDYKRAIKRGLKIELLEQVVALLAMGEPLPDKNRDHDLSGDWAGHRDCHILPDWLLVYRIEDICMKDYLSASLGYSLASLEQCKSTRYCVLSLVDSSA